MHDFGGVESAKDKNYLRPIRQLALIKLIDKDLHLLSLY